LYLDAVQITINFTFEIYSRLTFKIFFQTHRAGLPERSEVDMRSIVSNRNGLFHALVFAAGFARAPSTAAIPARIATQPANVTVRVGDVARFTVVATGTQPLTYVWLKNGSPIPSSDGPEWAVSVATAAEDGSRYRCVVANGAGTDSSMTATLRVSTALVAPSIRVPPDSAPVAVGDTAFIKISAIGTPPISFTWYRNGIAIPGATDSLLKLFPVSWSDNGALLKCRVANGAGVVESVPFGLRVIQPNGKTIVLQGDLQDIQGQSAGSGGAELFDVVVRLYKEPKGGTPIYEEGFLTSQGQGVVVRDGHFSVSLGQTVSTGDLSQIIQDASTLYVSFGIAKPGLSPETLEPRTPFTSAPYALTTPPVRLKGDVAPTTALEAPVGSLYQIKPSGAQYIRTASGWTRITP
jgi:hypothetical protein